MSARLNLKDRGEYLCGSSHFDCINALWKFRTEQGRGMPESVNRTFLSDAIIENAIMRVLTVLSVLEVSAQSPYFYFDPNNPPIEFSNIKIFLARYRDYLARPHFALAAAFVCRYFPDKAEG